MASHECLLQISSEPDPLLHLLATNQMFPFFNKLISSHLNIFIEKVAPEYLFAIFVVKQIGNEESETKGRLGHKFQVLVMEEDVVVVEED